MLTFALIIVSLIFVFVTKYIIKCRRLPPGPIGLPLVGYYPFMGKVPGETVAELAKTYGDIMTINLLGRNYWILNSIEGVEEAFVKNGDLFAGRPYNEDFNMYALLSSNCTGLLEGDDWKVCKRIILSNLASLGMGKSEFETRIHELLDNVDNYIDSKQEKPNDYFEIISNFSSNVITTLMLSRQYKYDDPEYIKIRDWSHNIFASFAYLNFLLTGFGFKLLTIIKPNY